MIKQALACFFCLFISLQSFSKPLIKGLTIEKKKIFSQVKFYEDTICAGESALLVVDAGPQATVQWLEDGKVIFMGDSLQTPSLLESKTYKVSYRTKAKSEAKVAFLTATVQSPSAFSIKTSPSRLDRPDQEVDFSIESDLSLLSCEWNFGDGHTDTLPSPVHEYDYPGRYEISVRLRSQKGCKFLVSKIFVIEQPPYIDFPSAFSPNDDGYNDTLRIDYYDLSSFVLKIYDRQGELIFETENPDFFWDGIDIYGDVASEGVYTCKISALTREEKSINKEHLLTLIR